MPYTLLKFFVWGIAFFAIGVLIGWLLRSLRARTEVAAARRSTVDQDEVERLRHRVANLETVVAERDRLRARLAADADDDASDSGADADDADSGDHPDAAADAADAGDDGGADGPDDDEASVDGDASTDEHAADEASDDGDASKATIVPDASGADGGAGDGATGDDLADGSTTIAGIAATGAGDETDASDTDASDDDAADTAGAEATGDAGTAGAATDSDAAGAATDAVAAPELDLGAAAAVLGTKVKLDDLTAVEGIGPKIAELCAGIGVTTWRSLADTEVATLQSMLDDAGSRYRIHDPGTWPRQAGLLAAGAWAEFKQLTDELDGGR